MADQAREATGVWMLRSGYLERTDTRERILPYGDNSRGVLILRDGGRMAAIITSSTQTGDVPPLRRKLLVYSDCGRITGRTRFATSSRRAAATSARARKHSARCQTGPDRQPRPEPKSLQAEQGAERTQRWVAPVVISPRVAPTVSAGPIAVSVRMAAWAKTTARVKTAASPHTEAPAHMAAGTPTARERV